MIFLPVLYCDWPVSGPRVQVYIRLKMWGVGVGRAVI